MSERKFIANAFVPSKEVDDPFRFAGRRSAIKDFAEALLEDGGVIAIFGPRGIGKSSLALQGSRIAQGDVELLAQNELEGHALTGEDRFITLYVKCSDETKNLKGIQQHMLNALTSLKYELDRSAPGNGKVLIDKQSKRKVSLKVFEHETTDNYDRGWCMNW